MIEFETLQMLIYQHVVQLTLLDYSESDAFRIAHNVAALAFDESFSRTGLARAHEGMALAFGNMAKDGAPDEAMAGHGKAARTGSLKAATKARP